MRNIIKYASLLFAAAVLFACEGVETNDTLKLTSDKNLLQLGEEATLTVTLGTKVITEGVVFYDSKNKELNLPDFKFKATEVGKYEIWANYGSYNSETVTISVTDLVMPEAPADPKPESVNFKVRALFTEFTTTGCGFCPQMKQLLHSTLEKPDVEDKVVLTACHSMLIQSVPDPAYLRTEYQTFANATGFPYLYCDMYAGTGNYTASPADMASFINDLCEEKKDIAAGISVASDFKDGQIVAKVTIKAAASASYRVGAFLLEDGIYGKQSSATADWMHTHDNVIRHIDASFYIGDNYRYCGHSVGEIEAGKTADYAFAWLLDDIWKAGRRNGESYGGYRWDDPVVENLHMAVFVSSVDVNEKGEEFYRVVNAIDCPICGKTPFEYAK